MSAPQASRPTPSTVLTFAKKRVESAIPRIMMAAADPTERRRIMAFILPKLSCDSTINASSSRSLAIAHAADGIRANCVCPGPIDTPMLQERLVDPRDIERVSGRVRVGRFGTLQEVANAALFLASDDASFITGASLLDIF